MTDLFKTIALVAALTAASLTSLAQAQTSQQKPAALPTEATTPAPAAVSMNRKDFLKIMRWDTETGNWVLRDNVEAPTGMKTRPQVKAERDQFLRTHRWDEASESWMGMQGPARDMSTLSRAQVRNETRDFMRTHEWDEETESWTPIVLRKTKP